MLLEDERGAKDGWWPWLQRQCNQADIATAGCEAGAGRRLAANSEETLRSELPYKLTRERTVANQSAGFASDLAGIGIARCRSKAGAARHGTAKRLRFVWGHDRCSAIVFLTRRKGCRG